MRRDTKETGSSTNDDNEDMVSKFKMINDDTDNEKSGHTKKDASSLSLLSNATSEQSDLNESRDENVIDFDPLFLQVSITIRHGKDTMITAPISQLPTCLVDLFKTLPSADSQNLSEIDFSKLSVSLDLLSIALAQDSPIPIATKYSKLQNSDRLRSVSLCSNLSFDQQTFSSGKFCYIF